MPRSESPDPTRQEAGFKAYSPPPSAHSIRSSTNLLDSTLNNPNVSDSAKEHARHVLEDQFNDVIEQQQIPGSEYGSGSKYGSENVTTSRGEQRNRTNVIRGYKAWVFRQDPRW